MAQLVQHGSKKDDDVGRILSPARIENNTDVKLADAGMISPDAVRKVEVEDALVDTGATALCLPASMIQTLGLKPVRQREARTAAGPRTLTIYEDVRLAIGDRDTVVRVTEIPDGSPVLIGQIPLEDMDLVPMPKERKLVPNPAHDGEWTIEVY